MHEKYLSVFKKHYPAKKLAPLLAIIVALSPFAIDTYLPAIPTMAQYFNVDIHMIELSIPIYLFGFALGQIIGGPISDNFGRKWVGIIGLTLFFLSSFAIIFTINVNQLWLLRFTQAFGGGFGLVICAAIVRDLYDGNEAAKIFTLVGFIMMIAPLIAPAIGALLLNYFNWQAIFILLGSYALLQVILISFFIPETKKLRLASGFKPLGFKATISNYKKILSHQSAIPFLLCSGFVAAVMFSFLTEISFLYIEYFGVKEHDFAGLFALNIISMMLCNRLNRYLLDHWPALKILKMGLLMQLMASCLLLSSAIFHFENLTLTVILLMMIIGSFGLIAPNNMTCYMHHFAKNSGTASAVIGSSQFAFGAIIGLIIAKLHNGTPFPMFSLIVICSTLAFLSFNLRKASNLEQ